MDQREIGLTREAVNTVVERIVAVESSGDANAKNPRSTATGAAQFIEATWLELIRKHRADLRHRPEAEILDLRRDPKLSRELTARFIERNARVLRRYGTPGDARQSLSLALCRRRRRRRDPLGAGDTRMRR